MSSFYADILSAERLKKCYDIAPLRVRQYLEAEVNFVLEKIRPGDIVLDLGCGYGRIIPRLAGKAGLVVGADISTASLLLGKKSLGHVSNCLFLAMDAVRPACREKSFDAVVCIQNGISAFYVDQADLIRESVRLTRPGGTLLFSTYSDRFWHERLRWFELQAEAGLLGEIDYEQTGNGVIVCKDGFRATTLSPDKFLALSSGLNVEAWIVEVDESSLFCEWKVCGHE